MRIDNSNYKQFSYFIIALIVISVSVVYGINQFLNNNNISVPFYIEVPSVPLVYGILFNAFDCCLWKWKIFKRLHIVIADDLNGEWKGESKSSYDNMEESKNVTLNIKQTATSIVIQGIFNESKSISLNANFEESDVDNGVALFYFYRSIPRYDAAESMAMHEGSAKLVYNKPDDSLEGIYYSGRNRNNYGTIKVYRK